MNKFENRNGFYTNKRILEVDEVTRDQSGEIVTIKGDIIRADTNSYGGTKLDAYNMNTIIENMIDNKLRLHLDYTFEKVTLEVNALEVKTKEFYVELYSAWANNYTIEIENQYEELLELSYFQEGSDVVKFLVTALDEDDSSASYDLEFKVLIKDSNTSKVLHKVFVFVTYTQKSNNPLD